jgi:hypothetical protein
MGGDDTDSRPFFVAPKTSPKNNMGHDTVEHTLVKTDFVAMNKLDVLYRSNQSLFLLLSGGTLGLLDSTAIFLGFFALFPDAASVSFLGFCLIWGFFPGLFLGGLWGLSCHLRQRPLRVALLGLLFTQMIFLLIVGVVTLHQVLDWGGSL